jgi:C-5 cytosine-specific DNA methylase
VRRTYQAARAAWQPGVAGEAYLALVKATSKLGKKVDHIEGCCASESRTSETVSLMRGVNRPSAFFLGGGMVRAGLGPSWSCLFANDFDPKKGASYAANWGGGQLRIENIANITVNDLPGTADLAWASFPCQDLSLAGAGEGLKGDRSGTFWPFWKLMRALDTEGRPPRMIVLENVCGTLTSHEGKDFAAIGAALAGGVMSSARS